MNVFHRQQQTDFINISVVGDEICDLCFVETMFMIEIIADLSHGSYGTNGCHWLRQFQRPHPFVRNLIRVRWIKRCFTKSKTFLKSTLWYLWDILGKFVMVIMVMVNIKFRVERCLYLVWILDGGFRWYGRTRVPLIILRYFNLCCTLNHNHDINPIIKIQFIF